MDHPSTPACCGPIWSRAETAYGQWIQCLGCHRAYRFRRHVLPDHDGQPVLKRNYEIRGVPADAADIDIGAMLEWMSIPDPMSR